MELKNRIKVVVGVVLLSSVIFSVSLYAAITRYESALHRRTVAIDVLSQVFERRQLAEEYISTGSDRPRLQWFSKQESIQMLLAMQKADFSSFSERESFDLLHTAFLESEDIFRQIIALSELKSSDRNDLSTEKIARLSEQLSVKTQETIALATELERTSSQSQSSTFRQIIILFSVSGILFLSILLASLWMIWRSAVKEVQFEEMKNDFMNIAAHDLRTPSTAVKGFVSMIRKGDFGPPPTGEIGEALKDVEEATDRMITMVNDFLTISRIEQGRLKIIRQPLDIPQFLHDLVRQLHVTIQNREVVLQLGEMPDLPKAFADREKIAQVVTNIIDNALKHTETGTVTVSAHKAEKNMIEIVIADTGTGISPEDLPKLFERYYRGKQTDAVATGRGGGLGLGLYVVKTIIELHGGTVWAESVFGKSTTMHLTLPIVVERG